MLGLDPEGPMPLDVFALAGTTVADVEHFWREHGQPTPISGDPHFRPRAD